MYIVNGTPEVSQYVHFDSQKFRSGVEEAMVYHNHHHYWRVKRAHSFFMSIEIRGLYMYRQKFEISLRLRGIVNGMSTQKGTKMNGGRMLKHGAWKEGLSGSLLLFLPTMQ